MSHFSVDLSRQLVDGDGATSIFVNLQKRIPHLNKVTRVDVKSPQNTKVQTAFATETFKHSYKILAKQRIFFDESNNIQMTKKKNCFSFFPHKHQQNIGNHRKPSTLESMHPTCLRSSTPKDQERTPRHALRKTDTSKTAPWKSKVKLSQVICESIVINSRKFSEKKQSLLNFWRNLWENNGKINKKFLLNPTFAKLHKSSIIAWSITCSSETGEGLIGNHSALRGCPAEPAACTSDVSIQTSSTSFIISNCSAWWIILNHHWSLHLTKPCSDALAIIKF